MNLDWPCGTRTQLLTWVGLAVAGDAVRIDDVLKDDRELVRHVVSGRSLARVNHVQYGCHIGATPLLTYRHTHIDAYRQIQTERYTDTHKTRSTGTVHTSAKARLTSVLLVSGYGSGSVTQISTKI